MLFALQEERNEVCFEFYVDHIWNYTQHYVSNNCILHYFLKSCQTTLISKCCNGNVSTTVNSSRLQLTLKK